MCGAHVVLAMLIVSAPRKPTIWVLEPLIMLVFHVCRPGRLKLI